jgi:diguanylate cyclase (GGDEF)-like protein
MNTPLFGQFQDIISSAQSILDDESNINNPLRPVVQKMIESIQSLDKRLDKISVISDHYQTQLQAVNERLSEAAHTDLLTGLPNRRDMVERLETEINRSKRSKSEFAILLIDIDHFKLINDTYGHIAGDHILADFSKLLHNTIRSSDVCARWGGDEFLVLLYDTKSEEVSLTADRIRKVINDSIFSYHDHTISLTLSVGGIHYLQGHNLDNILQIADTMLYQAKLNGRNQSVICIPE